MADEGFPLDWLTEQEREVMFAILTIIEQTILDKDLAKDLTGMLLVTIDEWGKDQ